MTCGLKGSGKSYYLCCVAERFLKKGYPVFSNYPIHGAYKLEFDDFRSKLFPENSVLIFDEAYNEFDSDRFRDQEIKDTFPLFFQSRKLGYTICLASQNPVRVVKGLRDVCDYFIWANGKGLFMFRYSVYLSYQHWELDKEYKDFKEKVSKRMFRKYNTYYLHSGMDSRDQIEKIPWFSKNKDNVRTKKSILGKIFFRIVR